MKTALDKYIDLAKDENGRVRIERLIPYFGGRKSSGMMKEVMDYIRENKIPFVILDIGNDFNFNNLKKQIKWETKHHWK